MLLEAVVSTSNESATVEDALRGAADAVCVHTAGRWATSIWSTPRRATSCRPRAGTSSCRTSSRSSAPDGADDFPPGSGCRDGCSRRASGGIDHRRRGDPSFTRKGLGFAERSRSRSTRKAVIARARVLHRRRDRTRSRAARRDGIQIGRQLGRVVERIRRRSSWPARATHDALTGLANRPCSAAGSSLAGARARHSFAALLFLDLDRFKDVQRHALGTRAGDQLLRDVSNRLKGVLRASDTVARFGASSRWRASAGRVRRCLLRGPRLRRATRCGWRSASSRRCSARSSSSAPSIVVTASIGIVVASGTNCDAESLLRDADIAMYRAKELGPGRWDVFDELIRNRALERVVGIERELRAGRSSRESCGFATSRSSSSTTARCSRSRRSCAGSTPNAGSSGPGLHPDRGRERPDPADRRLDPARGRASRRTAGAPSSATGRRCRERQRQRRASSRNRSCPRSSDGAPADGLSAGDLAIKVTESALIEDFERGGRLAAQAQGPRGEDPAR